MDITMWPVARIIPYARNARKIPVAAVEKVAASIQEFGWRQPIVVDGAGVIICGHTRLQAAQKLGLREAPVHVAENLTPAQVRAYRLLDNRSHEETAWDPELLGLELLDLQGMGVNLDLTGFNTDELDEYLKRGSGGGLCDEDAAPELAESAVTMPGEQWVLGPHRLLCGDATERASYEQVLGKERADLTFTDPPYGVDYEGKTKKKLKLQNDNLGSQFGSFLQAACEQILGVTDGGVYVCMASSELDRLKRAFEAAGGHWSTFLIWAKNTFTLGRSDYQRQYEPILYGWAEGRPHYWCGARDQGDVWFIDRPAVNDLHPTMKPVALIERAIGNSSRQGAIVLDPVRGLGQHLDRLCQNGEARPADRAGRTVRGCGGEEVAGFQRSRGSAGNRRAQFQGGGGGAAERGGRVGSGLKSQPSPVPAGLEI
jgi:ParB-like chromosome segregation protein Spo0J